MENELAVRRTGNIKVEEGESIFKVYMKDELSLLVEYDFLLGKWKVECFDKEIPIKGMLDYPLDQKDVVIAEVLRLFEKQVTRVLDATLLKRYYWFLMVILLLFTAIKLFFYVNPVVSFVCSIGSLLSYLALTLFCVYSFLKTKDTGVIISAVIWAIFFVLYLKTFII